MHRPTNEPCVHKFWYFRRLKMGCLSPYWLQIKFSMSLMLFHFFTFAINLWHQKLVTADVTAAFVNIRRGIRWRGHNFTKKFVFEGYTAKKLTDEFPEKLWTKRGANKLLKTLRDTGTVYRQPKIRFFNFPMSCGFCSKFHTLSSNVKSVKIG